MNSINLSLNDNFNGDPASIDCLRLVMTGDGACDVILNRRIKEEYSNGIVCIYGNAYIADTYEGYGMGYDDTGEDYCIFIQVNNMHGATCILYSNNDISFGSNSGGESY